MPGPGPARLVPGVPAAGRWLGLLTRRPVAAGMLAVGVAGGESSPEAMLEAGASFVLADLTVAPVLLALWGAAADDQ